MKINSLLLLLIITHSFNSCYQSKKIDGPLQYDLDNPSNVMTLPQELKEISGIDIYNNNELICEQDEKGSVYIYDMLTNNIKDSFAFAKDHDYEGIANVDQTIYVLKSNGVIFEIQNLNSKNQRTLKYKTFLNKDNNTEGLCYDKKNARLLIACKGSPNSENDTTLMNDKAIYAFDLSIKNLNPEPAYLVNIDSVKQYLAKAYPSELNTSTHQQKELFSVSDIAIHPISNDIFIVCSVGKLLIDLSSKGQIRHIYRLNHKIFKHPEGITFDKNGDMFISNEGSKKHEPTILKFAYGPME